MQATDVPFRRKFFNSPLISIYVHEPGGMAGGKEAEKEKKGKKEGEGAIAGYFILRG